MTSGVLGSAYHSFAATAPQPASGGVARPLDRDAAIAHRDQQQQQQQATSDGRKNAARSNPAAIGKVNKAPTTAQVASSIRQVNSAAASARRKPPILSPKPAVSPKPRHLSESGKNGSVFAFPPARKLTRSASDLSDSRWGYDVASGRCGSVDRKKTMTNKLDPALVSKIQATMDPLLAGARGLPPKVASKPTRAPAPKSEPMGADDPALAPVSARRCKFEQMKIEFKTPLPAPVFTPPAPPAPARLDGPVGATAQDLFKEILELEDLASFDAACELAAGNDVTTRLERANSEPHNHLPPRPDVTSRSASYDHSTPTGDWFADLPLPPPPIGYLAAGDGSSQRHFAGDNSPPKSQTNHRKSSSSTIDDLRGGGEEGDAQRGVTAAAREAGVQPGVTGNAMRQPQPAAAASGQRSIDDEILYYDNFDIMEKVRQQQERADKSAKSPPAAAAAKSPPAAAHQQKKAAEFQRQNETAVSKIDHARPPATKAAAVAKVNGLSSAGVVRSKPVVSHEAAEVHGTSAADTTRQLAASVSPVDFRGAVGRLESQYEQLRRDLDADVVATSSPADVIVSPPSVADVTSALSAEVVTMTRPSAGVVKTSSSRSSAVDVATPSRSDDVTRTSSADATATSSTPPKLPPKQHRFNPRSDAVNRASKPDAITVTSSAPPPLRQPSETELEQRLMQHQQRLKQQTPDRPKPTNLQPSSDDNHQTSVSNQQPRPQLGLSPPPQLVSPEEARARQLVDEPLAPIMEEDSTWGDSSCASSVTGDESSVFADEYSCHGGSTWSPASSRRNYRQTNDVTAAATAADDVITDATTSDGEASDASVVRWQQNPLSKQAATSSDVMTSSDGGQSTLTRVTSSEESDTASRWRRSVDAESVVSDVAPYGMVDLSKFEPNYEEERAHPRHEEEELTPSSILTSVQEFDVASLPRSPLHKSVGAYHFDLDAEVPTFPLDIKQQQGADGREDAARRRSLHRQSSSFDGAAGNPPDEEVGYDNLENYGGETRKAAEREHQHGKRSHDNQLRFHDNHAQVRKKPQAKPRSETFGSPSGRTSAVFGSSPRNRTDSLDSLPGLSRQTPGSRSSFPLAPAPRFARHSSAVTALDRHSGNLKRNKDAGGGGSKKSTRRVERSASAVDVKHAAPVELRHVKSRADDGVARMTSSRDDARRLSRDSTSSDASERTTPRPAPKPKKQPAQLKRQNSLTSSNDSGSKSSTEHAKEHHPPESFKPFPAYDESLDDGVVNPYEEVPFTMTDRDRADVISHAVTSSDHVTREEHEQVDAILHSVRDDSEYRPKPPMPRYPTAADYDNIDDRSRGSSGIGFGSVSSTPPPSPSVENKTSGFSDSVASTPASKRSSRFRSDPDDDGTSRGGADSDVGEPVAPASRGTLGSQLRNLLSSADNKYISPSLRRKRSLLKRSKSPGGSRRSKTPPRSGSKSSLHSDGSEKDRRKREDSESLASANDGEDRTKPPQDEEEQEPPEILRRSASQRIVDRRGRSKRLTARRGSAGGGGDDSTDHHEDEGKKTKSRWRRSKSSDRSPTRSKSKERKFGRSKSQERPPLSEVEARDIDIGEEERGRSRGIFRRSRSSSRKRGDGGRAKSSERKEDGSGKGRNPVHFFRKLLRKRDSEDEEDEDGIKVAPGEGSDTSDAYNKSGRWTPPSSRASPAQQRSANHKKDARRSPKQQKKQSHVTREKASREQQQGAGGSSSDGANSLHAADSYGSTGVHRGDPPSKPQRGSISNSLHSSDSENHLNNKSSAAQNTAPPLPSKRNSLRRNAMMKSRKGYDSDTAKVSDSTQSDFESSLRRVKRSAGRARRASLPRTNKIVSSTSTRAGRAPPRSKSDPVLYSHRRNRPENRSAVDNRSVTDNRSATENRSVRNHPTSEKQIRHITNADESGEKSKPNESNQRGSHQTAPADQAYDTHERKKYKTLTSLNAQTLRKVTERWLAEWRNKLPVGGFLITSWSDVALESHRPVCSIGSSVVYRAVSTGNNKFNLACQLYEQGAVDMKVLQEIESCSGLAAHPNVCGVCSHFVCRVPRSLLDPQSGGGAADAVCVVLCNRPRESLQDSLDRHRDDATEYHRQILLTILQLLHGITHLLRAGLRIPQITPDRLVVTEELGFLQLLPHMSDSSAAPDVGRQMAQLVKYLLQRGAASGRPGDRNSRVVVPGTKYSSAIKYTIQFLQRSAAASDFQQAAELLQCALWGPEDLDELGAGEVATASAIKLWLDMEQAKMVNCLAVNLLSGEKSLSPVAFMKHKYFSAVTPELLFNGLKLLHRI